MNQKIKNITFPKTTGPYGKLDHHPPPTQNNPPPTKTNNKICNVTKKNNTLKICTYNVRSLMSTERYLELVYALENITCDIIGLSEVRRTLQY